MADTDISAQAKTFREQFPFGTGDGLLINLRTLMSVLDATLLPLLESKQAYDDATAETRNVILQRFNTQIQPLFNEIVAAAQLGVIFSSTSDSPGDNTISLKALYLNEDDRNRFAAAAYLTAFNDAGTAGVSGFLRSYSRDTGLLLLDAISNFGTPGTAITHWNITAGADSQALRQYVQAQVAASVAQIEGGASAALDTLAEAEARIQALEARIVALVGTADSFGDTLGELEATDAANLKTAKKKGLAYAVAMSGANG